MIFFIAVPVEFCSIRWGVNMFFFPKKIDLQHYEQVSAKLNLVLAEMNAISKCCATINFYPDGTIVTASDLFLKTVGYELHEISGHHHSKLCPEHYASSEEYRQFWQKLANGEYVHGTMHRKHKNGSDIWLEASYIPIVENGLVTRVLKIANDVTKQYEQNASTDALVQAINKSNAVIDFSPDGIILNANVNFLKTMGYQSLEDIRGKHHKIFCSDEFYKNNPNFWRELSKGSIKNGLFERRSKNGDIIWIEATYNPVYDIEGNVIKITKVASDVTQRITTQLAVQKAAEIAHVTSLETAEVSGRAHELLKSNHKNSMKIVKDIYTSANLVEQLSDQSLEISKIVTTIGAIASQTNLLALNAAIEAARAGELGRGFAVVADEVRTLASRTTSSTAEIEQMVKKNSILVEEAQGNMQHVTQQASNNAELISEATDIMSKIMSGAERVARTVENLVTNTQHN